MGTLEKKLSKADDEMESILGGEKGEWHSLAMIVKTPISIGIYGHNGF